MAEQIDYFVIFRRGDEILFETHGCIETTKAAQRAALDIFDAAARSVREAINRGELPYNTFKICDGVTIEHPRGKRTEYSSAQISEMIDERAKLSKYSVSRDTRLVVYQAGGITGGMIKKPTKIALNLLSDQDFMRVIEITDLLQRPSAAKGLSYADGVGDFGYSVRASEIDVGLSEMAYIFKGGPFSHTPIIVEELEKFLSAYADRPDRMPSGGPLGEPGGI